MTAAILQSGLTSLIQDSKKKSPEVKVAAEKSLGDLKSLSITSEAQLAGDLLRKPNFVDPFVLACQSKNTKLASGAVVCLQRLAASRALPRERLKDVIDAFGEITSHGLDVQLKILQTLPSLLQIYAKDFHGELLAATLGVCGDLQDNRAAVVSSTATATFQQLITTVYEKVNQEDKGNTSQASAKDSDQNLENQLGPASYDAFRIFNDLCAFANGGQLEFLRIRSVSPIFVLEVIDSILHNSEGVLQRHPEQVEACRSHLMPAIIKILPSKQSFALTVRASRILSALLKRHVGQMLDESETALSLLVHGLDPGNGPAWRRALYMEVLGELCSDAALLRQLFLLLDQQEGRNNMVGNMMSAFVRIASEKPALIGISHQSTVPFQREGAETTSGNGPSLEILGATGLIGSAASADSNVTGISTEWSTVKTAYIDQLDKTEVQEPPSTYVYSLVLGCIGAFSEGLAKYVMPLSVPPKVRPQRPQRIEETNEDEFNDVAGNGELVRSTSDSVIAKRSGSGKYNMLINPLKFTKQPELDEVQICAAMIDTCWPAFLATCSTFLNAALDADFYHILVRSFQKLTQVAGVLELTTPRDAMLTTLAKAAVPTGIAATAASPSMNGSTPSRVPSIAGMSSVPAKDSSTEVEQSSLPETPRRSVDWERPVISTRNLLCLRALLNLGIALGPTLAPDSWFTILETLQHAELVIDITNKSLAQSKGKDDIESTNRTVSRPNLGTEIMAVQTASRRMFEGTAVYTDESLHNLILALLRFSGVNMPHKEPSSTLLSPAPSTPTSPHPQGRMHQFSRSISLSYTRRGPQEDELRFFLSRMSDVARVNLARLISAPAAQSGWETIFLGLFHVAGLRDTINDLRTQSVALMNRIVVEGMKLLNEDYQDSNAELQLRCMNIFRSQHNILGKDNSTTALSDEIDFRLLDALHSVLEACNNLIEDGWAIVFDLICSPYRVHSHSSMKDYQADGTPAVTAKSSRLVQPAFACLQLIGSDFLTLLPVPCLALFVDALWVFSQQEDDLNTGLTSTNFFWNLATYLQSRLEYDELHWEGPNFDETLLTEHMQESNQRHGLVTVWILLVVRLLKLSRSPREDVRNSSVRIFTRILELFGQSMSPGMWVASLKLALGAISYQQEQMATHEEAGWESSMIMMTEAVFNLLKQHSHIIVQDARFLDLLHQLFDLLAQMLELQSLAVASMVYQGTSKLLLDLKFCDSIQEDLASAGVRLWQALHPAEFLVPSTSSKPGKQTVDRVSEISNQEALTRHAELFLTAHELFPSQAGALLEINGSMESIRMTIFGCIHPQYTSDIKKVSSEQDKVLAMLPILFKHVGKRRIEYLEFLLEFVRAALRDSGEADRSDRNSSRKTAGNQRPTFVAFSCKCIDVLESAIDVAQVSDPIVVNALNTLAMVIRSKYTSIAQGTDPIFWQNATTKAINIIEKFVPDLTSEFEPNSGQNDGLVTFLVAQVDVATAILDPGPVPDSGETLAPEDQAKVLASESFDISAFSRLHTIIVLILPIWANSRSTPCGQVCASYAVLLLNTSFIASPFYGDLPSDLLLSPLGEFSHVRPGTVCEPIYPSRLRMPYIALDALFGLVAPSFGQPKAGLALDSKKHGSYGVDCDSYQRLARIAAPYLLLRCAWIFKSFIADQPLRGLKPLHKLLRIDLLTVINKCLETKTDDEAFRSMDAQSSGLSGNSAWLGDGGVIHLRILYLLVLRVSEVWRNVPRLRGGADWKEENEAVEIEQRLNEWLRVIGRQWDLGV